MRSKIISESMCKNKKAVGLVLKLKPVDLMKNLITDMGLRPKEAAKIILNLRKKAEGVRTDYPTPTFLKGDETIDEFSGHGRPEGPPRHHLPPDPRDEAGDWPYDAATTTGMATKNKQRKRGMTDDKKPTKRITKYVFGNVRDSELAKNGPGISGKGTHQKAAPHGDGNMPGSGTSWDAKGIPGWSRSPRDKEFDIPPKSIFTKDRKRIEDNNEKVDNAGDNDGEPQTLKSVNVGQGIPQIGFGGRNPGRRMGFRRR